MWKVLHRFCDPHKRVLASGAWTNYQSDGLDKAVGQTPNLTPSCPPSKLLTSNSLKLYPHWVPAQTLCSLPYTATSPSSSPQNLMKTHSALVSSTHSAPLSTRTHSLPPDKT